MKKKNEVLRWIVMPFAAVLATVVVYAIGALITGINVTETEVYNGVRVTSFTKVLTGCGLNFLVWGLFVMVAAMVAPRGKKVVMVVFSILACLITIMTAIYYATDDIKHTAIEYIYLIASLAGATIGPYYFSDTLDINVDKV